MGGKEWEGIRRLWFVVRLGVRNSCVVRGVETWSWDVV